MRAWGWVVLAGCHGSPEIHVNLFAQQVSVFAVQPDCACDRDVAIGECGHWSDVQTQPCDCAVADACLSTVRLERGGTVLASSSNGGFLNGNFAGSELTIESCEGTARIVLPNEFPQAPVVHTRPSAAGRLAVTWETAAPTFSVGVSAGNDYFGSYCRVPANAGQLEFASYSFPLDSAVAVGVTAQTEERRLDTPVGTVVTVAVTPSSP
jgi:hypothetical protein